MFDKMNNRILTVILIFFALLVIPHEVIASEANIVRVSDLDLSCISQGWGNPGKNVSVGGNVLQIAGRKYNHGVGTHSDSYFEIQLYENCEKFTSFVGIDNESGDLGTVEFIVELDGVLAWRSGIMKGGQAAKKVQLSLTGCKKMSLIVKSVDDDKYDHADWAHAIITYRDTPPTAYKEIFTFSDPVELPGGPANVPADVLIGDDNKSIHIIYDNNSILKADFSNAAEIISSVSGEKKISQKIVISFKEKTKFHAMVFGSSEAIAAETRGKAQDNFPIVRTSHGLSNNLRNNAIYDRNLDWMIEADEGIAIKSEQMVDGTARFELDYYSDNIVLTFYPRYYQKHKNLPYFQPWTYKVRKDSITGWCTWWAYMRNCRQNDVDGLLDVWKDKHFADFGYHFIQLDDVYQGGADKGRKIPDAAMKNYIGGRPETWLEWKKDLFPEGMTGYYQSVYNSGFEPGLWMGCFFTDKEIADQHPDWFVQGEDGKPFVGKWVTYVVDSTNPEAANALIRPTFRGLKNAGFKYLKIDQLRHMLYDNLNLNLKYMVKNNKRPDDIFRAYLRIAREELGEECFILSCWGVLPESIGLADGCRIGGDGYGPVTMQQYNSWNGIVWRNDPDHCDISPEKAADGVGNVTKTQSIKAVDNDTIIRPALASIAGCMLMLSDKPETYQNDKNLLGARCSSPVLFSVPGQLYDYDPVKTDNIKKIDRSTLQGGSSVSIIDADQYGEVCPFWLNEFNKSYENWYVLHRLNWTKDKENIAGQVTVNLTDLGLFPEKEYLAYEFWSNSFIGVVKNEIMLGELAPMGVQSLAIREKLKHPQIVSTNRHLSQGAAELELLNWDNNCLNGRSHVIEGFNYVITIYVPDEYHFSGATINGIGAQVKQDGNLLKIAYLPKETCSVKWKIKFTK